MNPQTPGEWVAAILMALGIALLFVFFSRQKPRCFRCGKPATSGCSWLDKPYCEKCYWSERDPY